MNAAWYIFNTLSIQVKSKKRVVFVYSCCFYHRFFCKIRAVDVIRLDGSHGLNHSEINYYSWEFSYVSFNRTGKIDFIIENYEVIIQYKII